MKKLYAGLSALGLFAAFGVNKALAAVDPDVASTTAAAADTLKDNMVSVISTNVPTIIIVGVIVMGIFLVWRLAKRFLRG